MLAPIEERARQLASLVRKAPIESCVLLQADSAAAAGKRAKLEEVDAGPKGALHALPILYICLAVEMTYVIELRLQAQHLMKKASRGRVCNIIFM